MATFSSASTPASPASLSSPNNTLLPAEGADPTPPDNRSARGTRSFRGCRPCREKKVKCDETRPQCKRCTRLKRECDYTPLPRKKYTRRAPTSNARAAAFSGGVSDDGYDDSVSSRSRDLATGSCPPPQSLGSEPDSPAAQSRVELGHEVFTAILDGGSPSFPPIAAGDVAAECAHILSPFDHSAIYFFCSVLPLEGDTKPPEYSGPSMIWMLARRSPMVLHMVCAVGGQKWCEQNPVCSEVGARRMHAIEHYGAALQHLLALIQRADGLVDIDNTLATLWLMILYEQKFGDGCGIGLDTHLQGVATIIMGQIRSIQSDLDLDEPASGEDDRVNLSLRLPGKEEERLSPVSCKLIVWMALIDGGAVMNGFGGAFNHLLGQAISGMSRSPVRSRLKCLRALQQRSSLVCHHIWGRSYPAHYLIDDMQNAQVACLYAESGQLRFLLGTLAATEYASGRPDQASRKELANGIRIVGTRYREVMRVAKHLELPDDGLQKQFVVLARFIVPFYYGIVLCFLRILKCNAPLDLQQREATSEIMSLSLKSFRDQGQKSITRLAWPLFVAALESDDLVHRTWISDRFDELVHRGEHFRRARRALDVAFREQRMDERRMSYWELVRRDDVQRFLI